MQIQIESQIQIKRQMQSQLQIQGQELPEPAPPSARKAGVFQMHIQMKRQTLKIQIQI